MDTKYKITHTTVMGKDVYSLYKRRFLFWTFVQSASKMESLMDMLHEIQKEAEEKRKKQTTLYECEIAKDGGLYAPMKYMHGRENTELKKHLPEKYWI